MRRRTHRDTRVRSSAASDGYQRQVALDAYRVLTAALSVSKATAVYSDPANGLVNPKAIPGAILTYTITIVNNGTGTATGISISDIVDEITTGTVAFSTQFNDNTTTCAAAQGIAVKDGSDAAPLCQTNVGYADSANFAGITATSAGRALAAG